MKKINPFLVEQQDKLNRIIELTKKLPKGKCLVVPFAATSSVFLHTNYQQYLLADFDLNLIGVYQVVASYQQQFINVAKQYFLPATNHQEVYEYYRHVFNGMHFNKGNNDSDLRKACLYLYLNRHCFKGENHYNTSIEFNAPFGYHKQVYFPEAELNTFITKFNSCDVEFMVASFEETIKQAQPGDVVFCYLPKISTEKRIYFANEQDFSWGDGFRLGSFCAKLQEMGIPIIIAHDDVMIFSKNSLT